VHFAQETSNVTQDAEIVAYKAQDQKWSGPKLVVVGLLSVVVALCGIFTAAALVPYHL